MDEQKKQEQMATVLEDLDALLQEKGKTPEEAQEIIIGLVQKAEQAVDDEIISGLSDDQVDQLAKMEEQNKSADQIADFIGLDPDNADALELKKVEEIITAYMNTLDEKKQ